MSLLIRDIISGKLHYSVELPARNVFDILVVTIERLHMLVQK